MENERKRTDEWANPFPSFEEEFEAMHAQMERMVNDMLTGRMDMMSEPIYYQRIEVPLEPPRRGPRRKIRDPGIQERPGDQGREPLMDLIEDRGGLRVLMEMPGIRIEDIVINAKGDHLEVTAELEGRACSRHVQLPCDVKTKVVSATCNNGVLDVRLAKPLSKKRAKEVEVQ
jgi:HSP20 family molecular chaperone IbpA